MQKLDPHTLQIRVENGAAAMGISQEGLNRVSCDLGNSTPWNQPRKKESFCTHKNLDMHVHNSLIHNSPQSETTQIHMSWMSSSCLIVSDSLRPHELYSPPGSSVHGILWVRILAWVAISFSRGSFQPRD